MIYSLIDCHADTASVALDKNVGFFNNGLQVDLDDLAEFSEHHRAGGYLTINLETGLPVELGMYMEKSHTIDGVAYKLEYRLEETLNFS